MRSLRDTTDALPRFGAPAATLLVVASMIGTGIFTTTGLLVEATPLLFVALSIWMIRHSVAERPGASIAGVGVMASAVALFAVVRRAGRRTTGAAWPGTEGDA